MRQTVPRQYVGYSIKSGEYIAVRALHFESIVQDPILLVLECRLYTFGIRRVGERLAKPLVPFQDRRRPRKAVLSQERRAHTAGRSKRTIYSFHVAATPGILHQPRREASSYAHRIDHLHFV